jgi:hypothetical protein
MARSSFGEDSLPVTTTESNTPWEEQQPPMYLILGDNYASVSDFARDPYNKAFGWVLAHTIVALIAHCVHRKRNETPGLGSEAARFSNLTLG